MKISILLLFLTPCLSKYIVICGGAMGKLMCPTPLRIRIASIARLKEHDCPSRASFPVEVCGSTSLVDIDTQCTGLGTCYFRNDICEGSGISIHYKCFADVTSMAFVTQGSDMYGSSQSIGAHLNANSGSYSQTPKPEISVVVPTAPSGASPYPIASTSSSSPRSVSTPSFSTTNQEPVSVSSTANSSAPPATPPFPLPNSGVQQSTTPAVSAPLPDIGQMSVSPGVNLDHPVPTSEQTPESVGSYSHSNATEPLVSAPIVENSPISSTAVFVPGIPPSSPISVHHEAPQAPTADTSVPVTSSTISPPGTDGSNVSPLTASSADSANTPVTAVIPEPEKISEEGSGSLDVPQANAPAPAPNSISYNGEESLHGAAPPARPNATELASSSENETCVPCFGRRGCPFFANSDWCSARCHDPSDRITCPRTHCSCTGDVPPSSACFPCDPSNNSLCEEAVPEWWCAVNCYNGEYYYANCQPARCICLKGDVPICMDYSTEVSAEEYSSMLPSGNCDDVCDNGVMYNNYTGCSPDNCDCPLGNPHVIALVQATVDHVQLNCTQGLACELISSYPTTPTVGKFGISGVTYTSNTRISNSHVENPLTVSQLREAALVVIRFNSDITYAEVATLRAGGVDIVSVPMTPTIQPIQSHPSPDVVASRLVPINQSLKKSEIAGIVIGCVAGAVIVIALAIFLISRRRKGQCTRNSMKGYSGSPSALRSPVTIPPPGLDLAPTPNTSEYCSPSTSLAGTGKRGKKQKERKARSSPQYP